MNTYQLNLPLVMPAQAQKHVTVNEALARIDAFAQLRFRSDANEPPSDVQTGESYLIPSGAAGGWSVYVGCIATFCNGGWVFTEPRIGWDAWDETLRTRVRFDGTQWLPNVAAQASNGAASLWTVQQIEHDIIVGPSNVIRGAIEAGSVVFGVTARVVAPLRGHGLASWQLGVEGSPNRYGSGLGIALNSYASGLTGSPLTYYSDTSLVLNAEGGAFEHGRVSLAVHVLKMTPPVAV